jgi:hypothetical protein
LGIQIQSNREVPERRDTSCRVVLISQNRLYVFSEPLSLLNLCLALSAQLSGSLFPKLPLLVYQEAQSCDNEKNNYAQNQDDDAENSLPPKKLYYLFLLLSALSCFL